MITSINEWKTVTNHISCECKCKFDVKNVIQIDGGTTINVDVSVKSVIYVKKRLYLESWNELLWKWKIFSKYHGLFSDHVWWIYISKRSKF